MEKKNKYYINEEENNVNNVSEPVSEYGIPSKMSSMPGCCTVDELNVILDQAEKNFSDGRGVEHEEAVRRIMAW